MDATDTSWNFNEMRDFIQTLEPNLEFDDRELEFWIETFVANNILEIVWDDEGNPNYRLTPLGRRVSIVVNP